MNQNDHRQVQPEESRTPDEEFEELRQRFHERLRKERTQLAALTGALGSANVASTSILLAVREFAHRLRGAALVFGFQGLGEGAKAVELAAIAALPDPDDQRCHGSLVATMQLLAMNLADEIGAGAPR